jgi:hypothetical protein
MKHWLAQQCRLPPALPIFPANREFYREFCKIAVSGASETLSCGAVTALSMQIPYSAEQGIILAEQGILAGEQGVYRPKLKSSPDEIFGNK